MNKFDFHNFPVRGQVSHVYKNIHLSDITFGKNADGIIEQGFGMVINVSEIEIPTYARHQITEKGIDYHYIRVDNDDPLTDLRPAMLEAASLYKTDESKILIHCSAGCSRSAAVVLYIMCHHHSLTLEDACDIIVKQRPCVSPMPIYLSQISELLAPMQDK